MLERLTVRNFQDHKDTTIKFGPVTTITGPTESGKSSLVRALQWICFNKPTGDKFIRWGADQAIARLLVDGHVIKRTRGAGRNTYHLDGKRQKAFSSTPPDHISQILNLTSINFQSQIDPPFWFTLTAGQLSRELNHIINLDTIDSSLAEVGREVRKARAEVELTLERVQEAYATCQTLEYVDDLASDITIAEVLQDDAAESASKFAQGQSLVERASSLKERTETCYRAMCAYRKAVGACKEAQILENNVYKLTGMIGRVEKAQRLASVRVPSLVEVKKLKHKADQLQEEHDKLALEIEDQEETERKLCQVRKKLTTARKAMEEMIGQECPMCGQPIKPV